MKQYCGDRTIDGIQVTVDGQPLADRTDLKMICDGGFEWGFDGPATEQVALAILADHLDDSAVALQLYPEFAREIVANFANEWEMNSGDIADAVDALSGG